MKHLLASLGLLLVSCSSAVVSETLDHSTILKNIAKDISGISSKYPQLKGFSASESINAENLSITYSHHTHKAEHIGGWTAQVPNPDPDGIWFYIDLHDPKSTRQIHTQPAKFRSWYIANKELSFLILEGKDTESIEVAIWEILKINGISTPEA